MSATLVVGAQWGDEGKGRVTDLLARDVDFVVRYQGGNNAGHTVIVGKERFALSMIPSGVMQPEVVPVIGSGVVIDPKVLLAEISMLEERGVDPSRLRISGNAHLIMPYHRLLDAAQEDSRGDRRIGTTGRGIGPAYTDKIARAGIRVQDLFDRDFFAAQVEAAVADKNRLLTRLYDQNPLDPVPIVEEYLCYADRFLPLVGDTSRLIWEALQDGRKVLLEGAQGTLLDIDHGTYPYVTSSNPTAGGASVGAGVGPKAIDRVVGVAKAYLTRVGSGPFPTELFDEAGDRMVDVGGEYGTVTGRRRRCGWLDLVALRYARRINSLTELFITKLDVLSGFPTVRAATGYRHAGQTLTDLPMRHTLLADCEPIYQDFEGWEEDITGVRSFADLPRAARFYIESIEDQVGVPVSHVSVGPERHQVAVR
ncbi:MAG: adenylosuccinate synthase [bacterium]|nr:adenylosuccinate synthase [bacterium]